MNTLPENSGHKIKSAGDDPIPGAYLRLIDASQSALGLNREMVGVSFLLSEHDYNESPEITPGSPISFCIMVKLATMGRALKAKEEHINCPGATRALGLTRPDADFQSGSRYFSFDMYEDLKAAKATTDTVSLIKSDVIGLAVKPLALHHQPPDVVLVICNPYQAMRIIQGYAYHYGPAPQIQCNGMQGVCSELAARAFLSQDLSASFLCSGTRFSCTWKDAELGVGLPFKRFTETFEGVLKTINGADSDKKKKEIIKRSDSKAVGMDVKLGASYYWRGRALRKS